MDASVIGTDFYIMEFLEGRIFMDPKLPVFFYIYSFDCVVEYELEGLKICAYRVLIQGLAPERREAIYRETAKVLAALHSVDVDAIGLGKYGRRDNYCKRQVGGSSFNMQACIYLIHSLYIAVPISVS
jgi:acyl-CoA dehydrogenase